MAAKLTVPMPEVARILADSERGLVIAEIARLELEQQGQVLSELKNVMDIYDSNEDDL